MVIVNDLFLFLYLDRFGTKFEARTFRCYWCVCFGYRPISRVKEQQNRMIASTNKADKVHFDLNSPLSTASWRWKWKHLCDSANVFSQWRAHLMQLYNIHVFKCVNSNFATAVFYYWHKFTNVPCGLQCVYMLRIIQFPFVICTWLEVRFDYC